MNSNSYFAKQYFPAFYFDIKDNTANGIIRAVLTGTSSLVAPLKDANYVEPEVRGGSCVSVPWHLETAATRISPIFARLTSESTVAARLTAISNASATLTSTSNVEAKLTGNAEAKVRFRRRKEEEVIMNFLLAA